MTGYDWVRLMGGKQRTGRKLLLWQVILPALGSALAVLAGSFLVFLPAFEQNLIEQKQQMIHQEAQIACGILGEFQSARTREGHVA